VLNRNLLLTGKNSFQYKFKYVKNNKNWHDAQKYCRSNYVDLATITDDTENTHLAYEIEREYDSEAWIGLSKKQGLWQWSDQTSAVSWSSITWQSGQPDNVNGNEECACAGTEGQMADDTCSTSRAFYSTTTVFQPRHKP
uniref:C-type lectin domain-containing protein n=1 Tax=Cyprinus carpio carpio TaxID=630221 RepID=A0A8C1DUL2_CYPCA